MAFLEAHGLALHYATSRGTVRALDGIDLEVPKRGEALGIVGESGSGKTTLALSLMRMHPANTAHTAGKVLLEGRDLTALSPEDFRREVRWRVMAMVFQGAMSSLNPVMRVGAQIVERPLLDGGMSRAQAMARTEELLELVGLPKEVLQRYPHELSGGMKQRVIIAMALIMDPKVLILDEPTSALDVSVQAQVMNLLKRLKQERRLTMVFITHDIALASDLCDRLTVAYAGEHVETGPIDRVLLAPQHPYTQKLVASIPRLHDPVQPGFLQGTPPDMVAPPPGCRFHPRCSHRFDPCDKLSPPGFVVGEGHTARCWLHGEARA
jgi:oligopeptide/dipeptide ABC transporter ATP-binding protein